MKIPYSNQPTNQPASQPTNQPTNRPSNQATKQPSSQSASQPANQPTNQPANQPSNQATKQPVSQPTNQATRSFQYLKQALGRGQGYKNVYVKHGMVSTRMTNLWLAEWVYFWAIHCLFGVIPISGKMGIEALQAYLSTCNEIIVRFFFSARIDRIPKMDTVGPTIWGDECSTHFWIELVLRHTRYWS